jgi:hypothetical protein
VSGSCAPLPREVRLDMPLRVFTHAYYPNLARLDDN